MLAERATAPSRTTLAYTGLGAATLAVAWLPLLLRKLPLSLPMVAIAAGAAIGWLTGADVLWKLAAAAVIGFLVGWLLVRASGRLPVYFRLPRTGGTNARVIRG
jgi:hypothetical protein